MPDFVQVRVKFDPYPSTRRKLASNVRVNLKSRAKQSVSYGELTLAAVLGVLEDTSSPRCSLVRLECSLQAPWVSEALLKLGTQA